MFRKRKVSIGLPLLLAAALACRSDEITHPAVGGVSGAVATVWIPEAGAFGCVPGYFSGPVCGDTARYPTLTFEPERLYPDSLFSNRGYWRTSDPVRPWSYYRDQQIAVPATRPITLTFAPGAFAVRVDAKVFTVAGADTLRTDLPAAARIIATELDGNVQEFDVPMPYARCQTAVNSCETVLTVASAVGLAKVVVMQGSQYHTGFSFTVSKKTPPPSGKLTLRCEVGGAAVTRVVRATSVACAVADENRVNEWRFVPDDARFQPVTRTSPERSWSGPIVTSGTVIAYGWPTAAKVGITPRELASVHLDVDAREWAAYGVDGPTYRGQGELPYPPRTIRDGGLTKLDENPILDISKMIDVPIGEGPNAGFTTFKRPFRRPRILVYINEQMFTEQSTWWQKQVGGGPAPSGYPYCNRSGKNRIELSDVLQRAREHEGIDPVRDPAQFESHAGVYQRNMPSFDWNAAAEAMVEQHNDMEAATAPMLRLMLALKGKVDDGFRIMQYEHSFLVDDRRNVFVFPCELRI